MQSDLKKKKKNSKISDLFQKHKNYRRPPKEHYNQVWY